MKILYVVCPNGFGHVKRSVIISEELIKLNSKISIHWYTSKHSNEFLESNVSNQLLKNSSFNIFNNNQSISLVNLRHFLFAERFKIWSQNRRM